MNKAALLGAAILATTSTHVTAIMSQPECAAIVRATQNFGDFPTLVNECVQKSLDQDQKATESAREQIEKKEEAKASADEAKRAQLFYVSDFRISDIDSAGGVNVVVDISNPNKASPIKYLEIRTTMYNAVGDRIASDIGGRSTATLQFTGPLSNAQEPEGVRWSSVWYNTTAKCVMIESLSIAFMDGKRLNLTGRKLRDALEPSMKNSCKAG